MKTPSVSTLTVTGFLSLGAAAAIPAYHKYQLGGIALTVAAKATAVALGVLGGMLLLVALYLKCTHTNTAATNTSNTTKLPLGKEQANTKRKNPSSTRTPSDDKKSAETKASTDVPKVDMKARMAELQRMQQEGQPLAEEPKPSAAAPAHPAETTSPLPPKDPATLSVVPTPPPLAPLPPSSSESPTPPPPAPPEEGTPIQLSGSESGSPPPAPLPPSNAPAAPEAPSGIPAAPTNTDPAAVAAPSAPSAPSAPGMDLPLELPVSTGAYRKQKEAGGSVPAASSTETPSAKPKATPPKAAGGFDPSQITNAKLKKQEPKKTDKQNKSEKTEVVNLAAAARAGLRKGQSSSPASAAATSSPAAATNSPNKNPVMQRKILDAATKAASKDPK